MRRVKVKFPLWSDVHAPIMQSESGIKSLLERDSKKGKAAILKKMTDSAGVMSVAARSFGIHRITLWHLIRDYGLWGDVERIRKEVSRVYGVRVFRRGFSVKRILFTPAT